MALMANVPNYQGMFLRGHGSQAHVKNNGSDAGATSTNHASGSMGQIQGDAARSFTGRVSNIHSTTDGAVNVAGSVLKWNSLTGYNNGGGGAGNKKAAGLRIDSSWALPIANEIRPVNVAVRHLIRCR